MVMTLFLIWAGGFFSGIAFVIAFVWALDQWFSHRIDRAQKLPDYSPPRPKEADWCRVEK